MWGWKCIGIDFHGRWREGTTRLDLSGNSLLSHWGWFTLEWAREPYVDYFREVRRAWKRPAH